jgi:hypothetical protein
MTAYELIQFLARYPADTEVCVSQKPDGYVDQIKYVNFEDDVIKLYGNGEHADIED